MFSKKIKITCFDFKKKKNKKIKRLFFEILQKKDPNCKVIDTFSNKYQFSYSKKKSLNLKNIKSLVFLD